MSNELLPRFHRLKLKLHEDILNNYSPGEKFLTQREIIKLYGASFSTVERALRELANEEVLVRIHGKGTFICDQKPFSSEGSMKIALVMARNVTYGPTSFYSQILMKINDELSAGGYSFSFIYFDETGGIEGLINQLKNDFCGALLIGMIDEAVASELNRLKFPFVAVDRVIDLPEICYVASDNANGASEAINYLVEMGHRKIGFVSTALHTSFLERYEGYCTALAENGIKVNRDYIKKHFLFESPMESIRPMFELEDPPTAIFTANDTIGASVVRALGELGLNVPEDVSVMGFDDDYIGAHLNPPLTTMAVPRQEMAVAAVTRLRMILSGREPDSIFLPVTLTKRDSVKNISSKTETKAV